MVSPGDESSRTPVAAPSSPEAPAAEPAPQMPSSPPPPAKDETGDSQVLDQPALGLCSSDRIFVIATSTVIVLLTVVHLLRLTWRETPAVTLARLPERAAEFQIDINRATWVEWMQLPELGETLSRQVVQDRQTRGPFESIEDVRRVRGIGAATMEKIRPFLRMDAPDAAEQDNGTAP